MANTATVYARIDPVLKKEVEEILNTLGITPSSLIQMLYSEIKLTRKVPLTLKIPKRMPLFMGELTQDEITNEVLKGVKSTEDGNVYSLEEATKILDEDSER